MNERLLDLGLSALASERRRWIAGSKKTAYARCLDMPAFPAARRRGGSAGVEAKHEGR